MIKVGNRVRVLADRPDSSYWGKGETFKVKRIDSAGCVFGRKAGRGIDNYVSNRYLIKLTKGGKMEKVKPMNKKTIYISCSDDDKGYCSYKTAKDAAKGMADSEYDTNVISDDICNDIDKYIGFKPPLNTILKITFEIDRTLKPCSCGRGYILKEDKKKKKVKK